MPDTKTSVLIVALLLLCVLLPIHVKRWLLLRRQSRLAALMKRLADCEAAPEKRFIQWEGKLVRLEAVQIGSWPKYTVVEGFQIRSERPGMEERMAAVETDSVLQDEDFLFELELRVRQVERAFRKLNVKK